MVIRGITDIRDAYRSDRVARGYIEARFAHALGDLLHARQVAAVARALATGRPRRVLEIAPGPARLTTETSQMHRGVGVFMDASAQMLAEARRRLGVGNTWQGIQGDAFQLPFAGPFELVYSFRLIRHFEASDRSRLYKQIANVLAPGGLFIFDAVNAEVSSPLRRRAPHEYRHFDALFDRDELEREVSSHGFKVLALEGVQHHYSLLERVQVLVGPRSPRLARLLMEVIDRIPAGKPLEWIALCQKV